MSSSESVVEAWGVRYGRQPIGDLLYPTAEGALRDADVGAHTVVPLIAADRLESDELVEVLARAQASLEPGEDWPSNEALGGNWTGTRDDEYRDGLREQARDYLAALRAHLESA